MKGECEEDGLASYGGDTQERVLIHESIVMLLCDFGQRILNVYTLHIVPTRASHASLNAFK